MTRRAATPKIQPFTVEQAMVDAKLLGAGFGNPETWKQWRTALKAAFGINLNRDDARAFASIAGGRHPPAQRVRELWCVLGRRSGKSRVAAALAVYFATLVDYAGKLAPGETGYVVVLAASKDQAKAIKNYAEGFLRASPMLSSSIADVTADEIGAVETLQIAHRLQKRSKIDPVECLDKRETFSGPFFPTDGANRAQYRVKESVRTVAFRFDDCS